MDLEMRTEFSDFCRHSNLETQTGIYTRETSRIIFGKGNAYTRSNVETINQYHPLVRFATTIIEKQRSTTLRPAVAAKMSSVDLENNMCIGLYLIVIQRWTIKGQTTLEKLAYKAKELSTNKYLSDIEAERVASQVTANGLEAKVANDVLEKYSNQATVLFEELLSDFEDYKKEKEEDRRDRADFQITSLNQQLENQREIIDGAIQKLKARRTTELEPIQKIRLENLERGQLTKLRKLEEKFQAKKIKIELGLNVIEEADDITAIIAEVD